MNLKKGVKLLEERAGTGPPAQKGDWLVYNIRAFLNRGEEVSKLNRIDNEEQWPVDMVSEHDGQKFINYTCILGRRQALAAIEYALYGMQEGGYRRIRASPHLAYRQEGVMDVIPENAVLTIEIWVRKLSAPNKAL